MSDGPRGTMKVSVKPNSRFDSFVQEMFFNCSSSVGTYHFELNEMINGKILIYVNNILKQTITKGGAFGLRDVYPFTFDTSADARVRVVFVPTNRSSPSTAAGKVEAMDIDASVDGCMTGKLCMNKLGDGSAAAYELRNDNNLQ